MGEVTGLLQFFIDFIRGDINILQLAKSMVKYILTIIIANFIFKWWYYEHYSFIEISMENLSKYIFTGEIMKPIFCFLVAYFTFYGVLFSLLRYLLSGWLEKKIIAKVNRFSTRLSDDDKRSVHSVYIRLMRKVIRWLLVRGIMEIKDLSTRFGDGEVNEMLNDAFTLICIFVQAIVVYGIFYEFFSVGMIALYIIGFLVLSFLTIVPIIMRLVSPILNKVLQHEEAVRR